MKVGEYRIVGSLYTDLLTYLYRQFPATIGHVRLREMIDTLELDAEKRVVEGERRGRIAGLREAAAICSRLGLSPDARVALSDEANRLEKDQHKSISSDSPETKTKQER